MAHRWLRNPTLSDDPVPSTTCRATRRSTLAAAQRAGALEYSWLMIEIRISSEGLPAWEPSLVGAVAALLTRCAAMGVLSGPAITVLDGRAVKRLVTALGRHGIGSDAPIALAPLAESGKLLNTATQRQMVGQVERLADALEVSAAPAAEWPAMRAVFGDEMLVRLLGVSDASMRRYAGGERATPDAVAGKLHWLALLVADLAGAYNDFGIRRWLQRPRVQLGGSSPWQLLGEDWSPDCDAAQRVRALAAILTGPQALAT